jgi:hypothetical protein
MNEISRLLNKLNRKKRFFTTALRDKLEELEKEGHITFEKFNSYAEDFYDNCIEYYLGTLFAVSCASSACGLDHFEEKDDLEDWKNVQVNQVFMKTVAPDFSRNDYLFDGFSYVQKFYEANWKCGMKRITKILLKNGLRC